MKIILQIMKITTQNIFNFFGIIISIEKITLI